METLRLSRLWETFTLLIRWPDNLKVPGGNYLSLRLKTDQSVFAPERGSVEFRTFTVLLSLDLSDDAMVKRGVTEAILKELYRQTQPLIIYTTEQESFIHVQVTLNSPFSVSVTWCSISSYFASSWNNNRMMSFVARHSTPDAISFLFSP